MSKMTLVKYENRRIYSPDLKEYLKIEDINRMMSGGTQIRVIPHKGDTSVPAINKITRQVLLQVLQCMDTGKEVFDVETLHYIIKNPRKAREILTKAREHADL